jgi:hypothetical protein
MSTEPILPRPLGDVLRYGGKFCAACAKWSEATSDTEGSPWERCALCGAVGLLRYYPPTFPTGNTATDKEGKP